jgi:hypothetical protein
MRATCIAKLVPLDLIAVITSGVLSGKKSNGNVADLKSGNRKHNFGK